MENRQLSIPIYLNQKIIFDLLAIIAQGFLSIKKVELDNKVVHGEELNNNLSFLSLRLTNNTDEEKVFTPSALFSKLRDELKDRRFLKFIDESFNINELIPGDFVEFTASLRKSPIIETFEGFIELMEVAVMFEKFDKPQNTPNSKKQPKSSAELQLLEMKKFSEKISQTNTLDLIGDINHNYQNIKTVVPVELEYFTNKTPADLIDGRFTVLGKVIRSIDESSHQSINLLRNTSLGLLPAQHRTQFIQLLDGIQAMDLDFPPIVTEVEGPALQIVPVCIYI